METSEYGTTIQKFGWNCSWNSKSRPSLKSSLHTTLTVLEAIRDFENFGYTYRLDKLIQMSKQGQAFILKKKLFLSESTEKQINPHFTEWHYPVRWKYDVFRALEYFSDLKHPLDERMMEALSLVIKRAEKGAMPKGSQYSGKIHFKLEETHNGRFNTLRALKILKAYQPEIYKRLLSSTM